MFNFSRSGGCGLWKQVCICDADLRATQGALVLLEVRKAFLEQIDDRFLSRSAIDFFSWLDLNSWAPQPAPSFASDCLQPIYQHWEGRLHRWNINFEDLLDELRAVLNVGRALVRPVDSLLFWRGIICGQSGHILFSNLLGSCASCGSTVILDVPTLRPTAPSFPVCTCFCACALL